MGTSCQHQFPTDARILLLQPLQQLAPRRIACDAKVGGFWWKNNGGANRYGNRYGNKKKHHKIIVKWKARTCNNM